MTVDTIQKEHQDLFNHLSRGDGLLLKWQKLVHDVQKVNISIDKFTIMDAITGGIYVACNAKNDKALSYLKTVLDTCKKNNKLPDLSHAVSYLRGTALGNKKAVEYMYEHNKEDLYMSRFNAIKYLRAMVPYMDGLERFDVSCDANKIIQTDSSNSVASAAAYLCTDILPSDNTQEYYLEFRPKEFLVGSKKPQPRPAMK